MKAIVTGCAGFIGSHLSKELITQGWEVIGIDNFLDYYPRKVKEKNIAPLSDSERFRFLEADVEEIDLSEYFEGLDAIFHLAAQAGVRASWGGSFDVYIKNNIHATQRLLEAIRDKKIRFVYASSSSVYGESRRLPMRENDLTRPYSPYGVSKLAAEHLCSLYHRNFRVDTTMLRLFTVYGPSQRPDMAFHKFIIQILKGQDIEIYGDGDQTRDFTFVSDVVKAIILAFEKARPGGIYNIAGGSRISLNRAVEVLEEVIAQKAIIKYTPPVCGDMRHTFASIDRAAKELTYNPHVKLQEGIRQEVEWIKKEVRGLNSDSSSSHSLHPPQWKDEQHP